MENVFDSKRHILKKSARNYNLICIMKQEDLVTTSSQGTEGQLKVTILALSRIN